MATILFYLTDVEEGGETIFPLEGRFGTGLLKTYFNYKACDTGFKVMKSKPALVAPLLSREVVYHN